MKNIICFFLFYLFLAYNVSFAVDIIVNEDEWPCKKSHVNNPKTSDFWPEENIVLNSDWKKDNKIKELVEFITNHANSIDQGKKAINAFSDKIEDKNIKKKKFDLVFSGVFQEMSLYLSFAKHGVFQFITRVKLAEQELVKENLKDKKYVKKNIGRSKKGWILEIADDAEEEAEFQCQRMDFLEKKTKALSNELLNNL